MSKGEFDIIKRYFQRQQVTDDLILGIGDDCALLEVDSGYQLAVTTDTLVSGVHFFADVDPYRLGYKSLAVNLSDLAAMGAEAKWISLAITLPSVDEGWLSEFCRGFFALADKYQVQLIGGDTTKGPLSITVTAQGVVKKNKALTRQGAKAGDIICVSGELGDGALGLAAKLEHKKLNQAHSFIDKLELTEPRLKHARLLVDHASACIDISDGLTQDLQHILTQSNCAAQIDVDRLPLSQAMRNEINLGMLSEQQAWQYGLSGGDDYELLFTVPADKFELLQVLLNKQELALYAIGKILPYQAQRSHNPQLIIEQDNQPLTLSLKGWDHFK